MGGGCEGLNVVELEVVVDEWNGRKCVERRKVKEEKRRRDDEVVV